MIRNRFLILFCLTSVAYFLVHLIFDDAPFYLIGGGIVGSLYELSDKKIGLFLSLSIWVALLAVFILVFYKARNKPLKFIALFVVALLMYVVDFILHEILRIDITDVSTRFLNVAIMVLSKGLILALIIYFEQRPKRLVNT